VIGATGTRRVPSVVEEASTNVAIACRFATIPTVAQEDPDED
jgi:hypothetical protein